MQEDELVGLQWMPLEEYLAIPFQANRPLFQKIHAACVAYADGAYRQARAPIKFWGLTVRLNSR